MKVSNNIVKQHYIISLIQQHQISETIILLSTTGLYILRAVYILYDIGELYKVPG